MQHKNTGYLRFMAMIATSMVVMLVLMYVHTYQWSHVRWSETRFLMMFVMGGGMGVVMLSFMLGMYRNRTINVLIYAASVLIIAVAIGLIRSQATVQDASYMKAMIPHHSIAILTSERAGIRDVRVRRLATEIIATQRREIREMEWLLDDIRKNGVVASSEEANLRPVPTFEGSR